jgi:hypothetical protein
MSVYCFVQDVVDLLEKRVRSRFVQEQITVEYCTKLEEIIAFMKEILTPKHTILNRYDVTLSQPSHSFLSQFISQLNVSSVQFVNGISFFTVFYLFQV